MASFLSSSIAGGGSKKGKHNRYSAELNAKPVDSVRSKYEDTFSLDTNELPSTGHPDRDDIDMRSLHKPFRMAKLNLVWTKAQQVIVFNSIFPSILC